LELIWSWGLLAYDITWMQYTVMQFMIYHIISIAYMGWFYPTVMLLLLTAVPLFAYDEYQTPPRRRDHDSSSCTTTITESSSPSTSATTTSSQKQQQQSSLDRSLLSRFMDNQSFYSVYLVAAVFSFLQTIPHRFPVGDLVLSGEGRMFGMLHHFQPTTVDCWDPTPFWLRTFQTGHSVPLLDLDDDNDDVPGLLLWPGGNNNSHNNIIHNNLQCDPWVVMQMAHYWCHHHPVLVAAAEAAAAATATQSRTTRTTVLDVYLFSRKRNFSRNSKPSENNDAPAAVTAVVYEEDVCHHFYWRHETTNIPDNAVERARGNILVYEWWKHNGWIMSPRHKYKRPPTTTTTTTPLQQQQQQ